MTMSYWAWANAGPIATAISAIGIAVSQKESLCRVKSTPHSVVSATVPASAGGWDGESNMLANRTCCKLWGQCGQPSLVLALKFLIAADNWLGSMVLQDFLSNPLIAHTANLC